jgi:hypothetical protein
MTEPAPATPGTTDDGSLAIDEFLRIDLASPGHGQLSASRGRQAPEAAARSRR